MKVTLMRARPELVTNTRAPAALSGEIGTVMPLGIAYIAAFLRKHGVDVDILDAETIDAAAVELALERRKPDVVGITSMTPTFHSDLAAARLAKRCGATVVMGGPHLGAMPVETMVHREIDYGVRGEGEEPMLALVHALEGHGRIADVPGIVYRAEDGAIRMNDTHIQADLDALPFPARDLLPLDRYESMISTGRLSTLCIGRGCPFRCAFCFKQPSDERVRYRAPAAIADEVEEIVRRDGANEINIVTDTLTVRQDVIAGFCEELLRRRIKTSWIAPTRADCVTPDLLRLMKRAGCRSLRFGVESGSPRILSLMKKACDQDTLVRAFTWAREAGLETFAYVIVGYLTEDEQTFAETLEFVRRLKPDFVMYNSATPLPGTPLFGQAVDAGLVPRDYWERFVRGETTERIPYLCHDTERWIRIAYRSFYFSPRFLWRHLLRMRPWHVRQTIRGVRGLLSLD